MMTFNWVPEFNANRPTKPSVSNISFGDGYEQRASFGLNTTKLTWNLSFNNRDDAEYKAIDAFLKARGGVEAFFWTPPDETAQLKWKCQEWTPTIVNGIYRSIVAKFDQVFDP